MADSNEIMVDSIERDLKNFLSNKIKLENVENRLKLLLKDKNDVQKKIIEYVFIF